MRESRKKLLVVGLIFFYSLCLRLFNLNQIGRTWDESAYVEVGNSFIKLIEKGDLLNNYFYEWVDEPPLARYIYGVFSKGDETQNSSNTLFNYDYTYSRFASALISSLSIAVVVLIGWEYVSALTGVYAGLMLSMLPIFLGFSQIATLESILFFTFTSSVYTILRFFKKNTYFNAFIAGIFLGFAILSKFTNILVIPLVISIYLLRKFIFAPGWEIKNIYKKIIVYISSSLLTFFIFWPMPLFNLSRVIQYSLDLRIELGKTSSIEVFFGRLIHVPVFYFFIFFLITTPLLVILLFFLGAFRISIQSKGINKSSNLHAKELKWILYTFIMWFCLPFIQSFYNFRHQGIRFIIEIYAPLSLIAAIGLSYIIDRISGITKKLIAIGIVILYLFLNLIKISPYYLDYFNGVVGGTSNVYNKGLFQLGWWGQGLREAGYFIKDNLPIGSSVGLAISPTHVFPPLSGFQVSTYEKDKKYDFVVVNYFNILREGFDDSSIKQMYKLIYTVKADGGVLVYIYKSL